MNATFFPKQLSFFENGQRRNTSYTILSGNGRVLIDINFNNSCRVTNIFFNSCLLYTSRCV